jgi:hypothetical protein
MPKPLPPLMHAALLELDLALDAHSVALSTRRAQLVREACQKMTARDVHVETLLAKARQKAAAAKGRKVTSNPLGVASWRLYAGSLLWV